MEHAEPAIREHAIDRQAVRLDVASILDDLERMALLNDASFALGRARREFHQGRSTGRIEQRLQALGVDRDTAKDAVTAAKAEIAGAEDDPDGDTAERYAAKRYAERRRLGPWRAPDERSAKREHDLARLIRQGFSFPLARSVIDGGG